MGVSASTLSMVNDSMDVKQITSLVKDFAKEQDKIEMKTDMMNDAMGMMGDPSLEQEGESFYNKILEEQALAINNEGVAVPKDQVEEQKVE